MSNTEFWALQFIIAAAREAWASERLAKEEATWVAVQHHAIMRSAHEAGRGLQ